MKKLDLTHVQEAGDFQRVPAGAYICVIRGAEDVPDREYLRITYDIAKGEYAGYYDDLRKNHPEWKSAGSMIKSYKEKALPMFKRFCSAVSKSNGNYVFDGGNVNSDESTLVGKVVGLLLGEEEYYSNSGDKRTRLYVNKEFPIDKIGEQKVPKIKPVKEDAPAMPSGFVNVPESNDDELPFS